MEEGKTLIRTVNGLERLVCPGMDATWAGQWDGWELVYARDLADGFHVRVQNHQFPVKVVDVDKNTVRLHRSDGKSQPPNVVWKGCLVWTYTGRN